MKSSVDNEALCCKDGDTVGEAIDTGTTTIGFLEGSLLGGEEGLFIGDKVGTLEGVGVLFIGFECGAVGNVFDTSIDGSKLDSTVGSEVSVVIA